jgi:hypothetical protein
MKRRVEVRRRCAALIVVGLVLSAAAACKSRGRVRDRGGGGASDRVARGDFFGRYNAHVGAEVGPRELYSFEGYTATSYPDAAGFGLTHAGTGPGIAVRQDGGGVAAYLRSRGPALDVEVTGPVAASVRGGRVELTGDGAVLVMASVARHPAADAIGAGAGAAVVVIGATAGAQKNAVTVAPGRDGQLLWIANQDDDPATIGERVTVAPGEAVQLIALDGAWLAVR